MEYFSSNAWIVLSPIEINIKEKINRYGTPLSNWKIEIYRGVLTGYNSAFIINSDIRNQLIAADSKSAELIRPILRGRDIQRYGYNFADLWLISTFPSKKYNIDDYPAIRDYLLTFGIERLEQTGKQYIINGNSVKSRKKTNNKWFETQDSINYWDDFSKPKIIWKRIGSKLRFSFDNSGIFCLDSTCFATGQGIPYLVAVLNTKMGNYLLKDSPKTGTGDLIISVQALEPVKVPMLCEQEQKTYEELLLSIFKCIQTGEEYSSFEAKLETMVFDAYKLTEEERCYVTQTVEKLYR